MGLANSLTKAAKFIKFSGSFLMQNKDLLIFPVISFIASIAFIALCILGASFGYALLPQDSNSSALIIALFLIAAYFTLSFIILFFTTSLYICALSRLEGKPASIATGMYEAAKKWKQLTGWCLISATVGLLLQALESLNETLADIIAITLGLSWSIASYFVIPILVSENIGPITAVKQGAKLFGKGWRKAISVNFVFFVVLLALWGIIASIIKFASAIDLSLRLEEISIAIIAAIIIFSIIVIRVLNTIIASGLYLSLIQKKPVNGLDQNLAQSAFVAKKK